MRPQFEREGLVAKKFGGRWQAIVSRGHELNRAIWKFLIRDSASDSGQRHVRRISTRNQNRRI
jgi:hypothetical protein